MSDLSKTTLTEKQESFALNYVMTANATEAYRIAYEVDPNDQKSWHRSEALKLLDHPKIRPRIIEIKERVKANSEYTVMQALEEYEEARVFAHDTNQAGAAVSAVSGKVKLIGLDKPTRMEHTGAGGEPIKVEDASAQEIARRLAFLLRTGVE